MHADSLFRAIGIFAVKFRWLVLAAWVAGTIAAISLLPALSSVTQSNNTKFLPASAPSEHAAQLAAPFGTAGLVPVPVVAARSDGPLTAADARAVVSLQSRLARITSVSKVIDSGRSPDGQAMQLVVLARQMGGGQNTAESLVDTMRADIASAGLPTGLHAHLAGTLAVQVDQQKASGNTGSQVQNLSLIFIIVLLVLIFRSLTLALATVAPALVAVLISGPLVAEAARHGLQVSPLAQYLMIVLVLGAGTDYGLFLVFRVREELREAGHADEVYAPGRGGLLRAVGRDLAGARPPARQAIVTSVTRVGESITFSAGTVIAAVLTLLVASFPFYSDLGIPFAIAVGVTLAAGLTLLPALLSVRLSLLAVKRTVFAAAFRRPKLLPWSIQGSGRPGVWGSIAGRIVRRPVPTLLAGLVLFGGLAFAVLGYQSSGFGGNTSPPAGSDSAAGTVLLARHFPQSSANPTSLIFRFSEPVWQQPAELAAAQRELAGNRVFTTVTGPLNPVGTAIPPATYAKLHARLGPASALPPVPPVGVSGQQAALYQLYRASANYVSADGRTVQFSAGLRAGDPGSTSAMRAVPAVRHATTAVAASVHASDSAAGGQAPALYDISSISNSDLARVIPIAILAIGVLLALVLRSVVAPLYLIASVGISYLAALGLAVVLFVVIGGSGGLVFFLPFLMFIFLLALGED
ncbi:MAG TPA: MMPL family transporter, partial [Streptosporangiaceae bacterium]|nr:MMPL family transporter [Streptosporangiaceae bacterium]